MRCTEFAVRLAARESTLTDADPPPALEPAPADSRETTTTALQAFRMVWLAWPQAARKQPGG